MPEPIFGHAFPPAMLPQAQQLQLYNSLTRTKQVLEPLVPGRIGMYVCGPTVYGDPHLGHARPAIVFDVLNRYLQHLGYKVRFVRNITDVGHLENDADEGEDKIAKKARLEQLEPMEVAQHYTDRYHHFMDRLKVLRPNIEPRATGHIVEQIELTRQILANGFAYEVNGSVYFDVPAYRQQYPYGELSGRTNLDDLLAGSRELEAQGEKRHPADFALWKKAGPQHIMQWPSPWGPGFPGWHLECTAMSTKYLGSKFDIHGGGMDLKFPHHEGEIAQSNACRHPHGPFNEANLWMHNNLLTINGQKMGKSLGNFITLEELFAGTHPLLSQGFSPGTLRFFTLQAHYRSTLDFSNDALLAAQKGLSRLMHGLKLLHSLQPRQLNQIGPEIDQLQTRLYEALNDDLNTPIVLAHLFDLVALVHRLDQGEASADAPALQQLQQLAQTWVADILGLEPEAAPASQHLDAALHLLVKLRQEARVEKNYALSDRIRQELEQAGVQLQDGPDGTTWRLD